MLRKLIKHEFRATARTMVPLFLILLAVTVCAFVSVRFLTAGFASIISGSFMFLFVLAIIATLVMSFVLMIQRFHSSFLTDEGYLMFTLPVSVHSLVWSKLIVSTVWFIATGVAVVLATFLSTARAIRIDDWQGMFSAFGSAYGLNGAGYVAECLLAMLLGAFCQCLMLYAAMALGHSFSGSKGLWSVLFAVGFLIVAQMLGVTTLFSWFNFNDLQHMSAAAQVHASMGTLIAAEVVYGAVFYFVTTLSLKKSLNLE